MIYEDEDMLMLSGIQHYMFCPRQWALIHVEQQWNENRLTTEGNILHQNVDNPFYRQNNNGIATLLLDELTSRDEIAEIEVLDDCFDMTIYLDYCSNLDEEIKPSQNMNM